MTGTVIVTALALLTNLQINADTNISKNIDINSHCWNFVADAKNLTKEEKTYYNEKGDACRQYPYMGSINIVRAEVEAIDAVREIKKLKEEIAIKNLPVLTIKTNMNFACNTPSNKLKITESFILI